MKRNLLMVMAMLAASYCLSGCSRFEGWHRPDVTTGEPSQRNEVNRGVLDVDDNFGTGMGTPVHHADW